MFILSLATTITDYNNRFWDHVGSAITRLLDYTPWHRLGQMSPVIELVLWLLVAIALIAWGIIIEKYLFFRKLEKRAERFESLFWSGMAMDELFKLIGPKPKDPLSMLFASAMNELMQNPTTPRKIDRILRATLKHQRGDLEKHLGLLSAIASSAPFIGLFGAVWAGINVFSTIARHGRGSLTLLAPQIVEGLLTIALALLVIIPAIFFYKKFLIDVEKYFNRLEIFIDEFPIAMQKITMRRR